MKENFRKWSAMLFGLLVLAGCAGSQPPVTFEPETGQTVVGMKAENFKFVPNNIKVRKGVVLFRIENVSGSEHNFTLKDPQDHVLRDVRIPPQGTVTVRVDFAEPGAYTFFCDEPFHAVLGMKGGIEVVGAPGRAQ
ncbi:MAG: cupredoxin domain-containing protein [Nitrospirae bacterium]|nr:cupredoxin domain-containing protein [Nitrospirota bacterium]